MSEVEFLLTEQIERRQISTIQGLAHLICSDDILGNSSSILNDKVKFFFQGNCIVIELKQSINAFDEIIFYIKMVGNMNSLEVLRGEFLSTVKPYFGNIYIIKDDVSISLAIKLYPYINKVENLLRQYIMHYMILKIGSGWWTLNVTDNVDRKSKDRNQKSAFKGLISQDIYQIDFKDLGGFIFDNFSIFKTKNDILKELNKCNDIDDFNKLKENIISNWDKYFKDIFNESWKNDWEELAEYRNQVAHNKLIERKTFDRAIELTKKISDLLIDSMSKLESIKYSQSEVDIMKEQVKLNQGCLSNWAKGVLDDNKINMEDIITEVNKFKEDKTFTTIDIINHFVDSYEIGSPINKAIGLILSSLKKELKITKVGNSTYTAENGGLTTTIVWKHITEEESNN